MLVDDDARKCAALAVRLAAVLDIEAADIDTIEPDVENAKKELLAELFRKADWLLHSRKEGLQDAFQKVLTELEAIDIDDSNPAMAPLRDARDQIVRRLQMLNVISGGCASCLCRCAGPSDETTRSHCPCIGEIIQLMHHVQDRVRGIYQLHTSLPDRRLHLALIRADEESGSGMFPGTHVNGYTNVQDADIATVGLEIRDCNFDWPTLCQTLYVFVHEMVCHAYQGLRGERRRNTDELCSWSEGWMDSLAWAITEELIDRNDAGQPQWLSDHREFVKEKCLSLHCRRYEFPHPSIRTDRSMKERCHARDAFRKLRRALNGADNEHVDARETAKRRAQSFSILLNLHPLDPSCRGEMVYLLSKGLFSRDPARFESVIGDCSEFCCHESAERLRVDLHESVYGLTRAARRVSNGG